MKPQDFSEPCYTQFVRGESYLVSCRTEFELSRPHSAWTFPLSFHIGFNPPTPRQHEPLELPIVLEKKKGINIKVYKQKGGGGTDTNIPRPNPFSRTETSRASLDFRA